LDPSIFLEIMSGAASSLARHTRRGAVASFYVQGSFHAVRLFQDWVIVTGVPENNSDPLLGPVADPPPDH